MKPQTYNNFIGSQGSKPNVELIHGIVNVFGVNPLWLLNGTGPMFLGDPGRPLDAARGEPAAQQGREAAAQVRESPERFGADTQAANIAEIKEEIRTLEPVLVRVEDQIRQMENVQMPAVDRLLALLKRYFELDPASALEEFKSTLQRIDRRISERQ